MELPFTCSTKEFPPRAKSPSEIVSRSFSFQGPARRNPAKQRQFLDLSLHHLVLHGLWQLHNFNRTALVISAPDETLLLERRDVLVNRRERRQLQSLADLLKTRRVAVLRLKGDQVIQHFFLPFCQRHL